MEKKLLKIGDVDRSGRPLSDRFIHFWNETTPAEVENVVLKDQVNSLIKHGETVNQILEQIKPISEDTHFVKNIYIKAKPSIKKVSAKEAREQRKIELAHKMLTRGKKS